MKKICMLILCSVGAEASFAQDLTDKWSGPHFGAFISQTEMNLKTNTQGSPRGLPQTSPVRAAISSAMVNAASSSDNIRERDSAPGIAFGYLWQKNSWVYGLEADFQEGAKQSSAQSRTSAVQGYPNTLTAELDRKDELHYLASLRGKFGYAYGNWLAYLTAGPAYGKISTSSRISGSLVNGVTVAGNKASNSDQRFGWTAGAGLEYAVSNDFRLRAEYVYYDLGSMNLDSSYQTTENTTQAVVASANTRTNTEWRGGSTRIGLSYHF